MAQHPRHESRLEFIERVRAFEQRLLDNMRDVFVPVHLCLGQEEVAADIWENIRPDDWLYSTHRNHGHYLAKGGSEQKLWDEIMGLPSGVNGGFSGSQGVSDGSINFHASAIVGGLVAAAAGTAYALKMDENDVCKVPPWERRMVVCCVGDGGTEAGVFWETLNWSALHRLPIAFIVENNGMSVDSPIAERQYASITDRMKAFGIKKCRSVRHAFTYARLGCPAFHEAQVSLSCSHIYMANLLPKEVIA